MNDIKKNGDQLRTDWTATAFEMLKQPMDSGLLTTAFGLAHIPLVMATQNPLFGIAGVGFTGLGVLRAKVFIDKNRKTLGPGPSPGG